MEWWGVALISAATAVAVQVFAVGARRVQKVMDDYEHMRRTYNGMCMIGTHVGAMAKVLGTAVVANMLATPKSEDEDAFDALERLADLKDDKAPAQKAKT